MLVVEAGNLFIVRAVLVPWLLLRSMGNIQLESSFSLIKKSFAQWFLIFLIILAGSIFGRFLSPDDSIQAFQVGTAAIAILTGFLILANQRHVIGQVVGVITFEGGLTLVELLSKHAIPLEVYSIISIVFIFLLLTLVDFINKFKITSRQDDLLIDGIVL